MNGIFINDKNFQAALKKINFSGHDLLNIEGAGARVLINGMRLRVPVDTGATRASVNSHIVMATETKVEDEVGPETNYAPFIEYGVKSKPNYPIQPFVRPTVAEDEGKVRSAIDATFRLLLESRWPK